MSLVARARRVSLWMGRRIGTYSRGMTQRLVLAAAALLQAGVLVLDEVLAGVDPLVQRHLREQVVHLARSRVAVLIASHDLGTLERLATRVVVLWEGRLIALPLNANGSVLRHATSIEYRPNMHPHRRAAAAPVCK